MKTFLTAIGTASACTAARWYLNRPSRKPTEYAAGHVRLTALWNEDAAFGLKIPAEVLLSLSGAALGTVWTQRRHGPVAAGLILGGGLSNLLERVRHKRVYDYMQFPTAPTPLNKYVYNLADFAVVAGGLGLLLSGKKS